MNKRLLLLFAVLSLWGCDMIHEFPCGEGVNPYLVDVDLDIDIDMNFDGEISPETYAAYSSMLEGDYDIRYTVDIYKAVENQSASLTERVARIVRTSSTVVPEGKVRIFEKLKMPVDRYVAMAWVDFVEKGGQADHYYNTERLTSISILKPDGAYAGYSTTKDAFCGSVGIDLTPFRWQRFVNYTVTCPARRPMAMYQVITTDIEEYVSYNGAQTPYTSIRPSTAALGYQLYFPMGYNVQFEEPGQFTAGIGYNFDIVEISSGQEAILVSDFVFVSDDAFYYVDFEIRDAEGALLNTIRNLRINLKRNMVTIIRDEFLTKDHNSGGVGIDDGFEGEEIIIRID